jgi:hypothetical protein
VIRTRRLSPQTFEATEASIVGGEDMSDFLGPRAVLAAHWIPYRFIFL